MAAIKSVLKPLSEAPGLGPFWMFGQKNLAESLINETRSAALNDKLMTMYLGPRKMVVAVHPDAARDVVVNSEVFIKSEMAAVPYDPYLKLRGVPDLVMSNGADWKEQRHVLNPAFATAALENMMPMFSSEADNFLAVMQKAEAKSETLSVVDNTSAFALDVLGNALLGKSFGALDGTFDETYAAYKLVMARSMHPLTMIFPLAYKLPVKWNTELIDAIEIMYNALNGAVIARKAQRETQRAQGLDVPTGNDILDMLLPTDSSKGLKAKQIIPNMWTMFIAGHDTTAIALAWLLDGLAQRPHIQDRARKEVLEVFGNDPTAAPTAEQIKNLPYMDALLKENLRLHPPVHTIPTRTAAVDTELGGYAVPKGTTVGLSISTLNRHPQFWDDPDTFDPERFLNGKKHRIYHWMPFAAGPRRCLGDRFSLMEQKTLLSKLLSGYEILPEHKREGELLAGDLALPLVFKQPQPVNIITRRRQF